MLVVDLWKVAGEISKLHIHNDNGKKLVDLGEVIAILHRNKEVVDESIYKRKNNGN